MNKLYLLISPILIAGCSTSGHWQTVTTEHHGNITSIHHRKRVGDGAIDHIETINAKGVVTEAEVHVYDLGRLPDGNGGVHEAHRFYKVVRDSYANLNLPKTVSSGSRTGYTPPNYVPPPSDQRINDAVTEAKESKRKLDEAQIKIIQRLNQDNALRGQLQEAQDSNQALQDKLNASMSTPTKPTEAPKDFEGDVDQLAKWGRSAQP